MSINSRGWVLALSLTLIFCGTATRSGLIAKTIEIESEDDPVSTPMPALKPRATSTPIAQKKAEPANTGKKAEPVKVGKTPVSPSSPKKTEAPASSKVAAMGPRVRMDEKINLNYFLKSGYVVQEATDLVSIGRIGALGTDLVYDKPKRCRLLLPSSGTLVKAGDLFVVCRASHRMVEKRSGFSGYWVRDLAVVKVLETGEEGALAQVRDSFEPFKVGDLLVPYQQELDRWNGARVKKPGPSEPVHCFVAGGDPVHDYFSLGEVVVLTAGSDQGLVEGLDLRLRVGKRTDDEDEALGEPVGKARVLFAGPGYSMAQIVQNAIPIQKSFEARYEP